MSYNGYTNYETWAVKLWIDNDQGSQEYWLERAQLARGVYSFSKELQAAFDADNPLEEASVYAELLGAASSSVDWYQIAEHLIEDAEELAE